MRTKVSSEEIYDYDYRYDTGYVDINVARKANSLWNELSDELQCEIGDSFKDLFGEDAESYDIYLDREDLIEYILAAREEYEKAFKATERFPFEYDVFEDMINIDCTNDKVNVMLTQKQIDSILADRENSSGMDYDLNQYGAFDEMMDDMMDEEDYYRAEACTVIGEQFLNDYI